MRSDSYIQRNLSGFLCENMISLLACLVQNTPKFPKTKNEESILENWRLLSDMLKKFSIASVLRILNKKTLTYKEIHIKYAWLAMLLYAILPTTHYPKILVIYAK